MEIFEFFIIPSAIFSTGLIIWILLGISARKLELSKGEIQIGKIDKQVLINLSLEQRKAIRRIILLATFICSIFTSVVAFISIKLSSLTLSTMFVCMLIQILIFLICGIPFYKKLRSIIQVS